MTLDPWTLAFQVTNLLVLCWLLNRFLYRPVLAMVAQRQAAIADTIAAADADRAAAERARLDYVAKLAGIEAERDQVLAAVREAAAAERARLIDAGRDQAARLASEAQAVLNAERRAAEAQLVDQAVDLALDLAQVLMRRTGGNPTQQLLDRALDTLAALPADERSALARDGVPEVATAEPRDPATERACEDRLSALLGPGAPPARFVVDSGLLVGVELRFRHRVIAESWRDTLAEARRALLDTQTTDADADRAA